MKQLMVVGIVALVVFAAAFGVSKYLDQGEKKSNPDAEPSGGSPSGNQHGSNSRPEPGAPARSFGKSERNPTDMAEQGRLLEERAETIRHEGENLETRRRELQGILEEIKKQKEELRSSQDAINANMLDLEKKTKALADKYTELGEREGTFNNEKSDFDRNRIQVDQTEVQRLKTVAQTYDQMDPEVVATLLLKQLDIGNKPWVVKALYYMKARARAKVLQAMTTKDPDRTADLSDAVQRMELPPANPVTPP